MQDPIILQARGFTFVASSLTDALSAMRSEFEPRDDTILSVFAANCEGEVRPSSFRYRDVKRAVTS